MPVPLAAAGMDQEEVRDVSTHTRGYVSIRSSQHERLSAAEGLVSAPLVEVASSVRSGQVSFISVNNQKINKNEFEHANYMFSVT